MTRPLATADMEVVWQTILAAAEMNRKGFDRDRPAAFTSNGDGKLVPVAANDSAAMIRWEPGHGWIAHEEPDAPGAALFDLYLPIASSHAGQPLTVGHLGQSLDGFIATPTGDSCYVTGEENVCHLHRMRALCDAIVVGAGTVAADDPQLTTRRVPGPNPLRVVLDRARRLDDQYGVFNDGQAATALICGEDAPEGWPATTQVDIIRLPAKQGQLDLAQVVAQLRARGCTRIFIEGGGITVSAFLEAKLLDRLQVAVAPLIIGEGRPAIRLPAPLTLRECIRPQQRIFRMGEDILFECIFTASTGDGRHTAENGALARIL